MGGGNSIMTQTTARIKKTGKNFEIIVDMEQALKFKKGEDNMVNFLQIDEIYSDSKKGFKAPENDLKSAFGTTDVNEIASQIVKQGEILLTQEHRDEEREKKMKQVIDFLTRNAINPQTGHPHTSERIKSALDEAHVNLKNIPVESQISEIINNLKAIIPIKVEIKKVKITIPAIHTGKAYGVINQYKEKEQWLNNGDLEVVVEVPSGLIMDFYDKLNSVTQGSALTEEIKEE
jgi:ribosome maturation protein SDO1